jgi:hypothetical protein
MNNKIRRIRCGTKQCSGFIDTQLPAPSTTNGSWQFHCSRCGYWSLISADGGMRATSKDEFDLNNVSSHLRSMRVTREPAGGV